MKMTNQEYLDKWWNSLTKEQKDRVYSGDTPGQDEWWSEHMPLPEKYMMKDKWTDTFRREIEIPMEEALLNSVSLPTMSKPSKPVKIPKYTAPVEDEFVEESPELDEAVMELADEFEEDEVVEDEPKKVVPPKPEKKKPLAKNPDFENMKMHQLRKYAQQENIKTFGKKKIVIVSELIKAYS